jgi:hypothetical protein
MPPLNINLGNVQTASDYEAVPVGDYWVMVKNSEQVVNKDGNGKHLKLTLEIKCGPGASIEYAGRTLFHRKGLGSEKSFPFLKKIFVACGFTDEQIMQAGAGLDSDWLIGKEFICKVTQREYNQNMQNDISQEKSVSAWTHAPGQAAAQPSMLQSVPNPMAPPVAPAAAPMQQPMMGAPAAAPAAAPMQQPAQQQWPSQQPMQPAQPQQGFAAPQQPMQPAQPGIPNNGQPAAAQPQQTASGFAAPPPPGGPVPGQGQ